MASTELTPSPTQSSTRACRPAYLTRESHSLLQDARSVLETTCDPQFDRVVRLALRLFDVPVAVVSIVDAQWVWFKGRAGATLEELAPGTQLFTDTLHAPTSLVIEDLSQDPRYWENPISVNGEPLCFYAGHSLRSPSGSLAGTLSLFGARRREWTSADAEALEDLAAMVEQAFVLRSAMARLEAESAERTRFETLARSAPVGVFSMDGLGLCNYANQAWRDITGLTQEQALGDGWTRSIHSEDAERVLNAWRSAIRLEGVFDEVFRCQRTDSELRWVKVRIAPVIDKGSVAAWVGVSEDITEARSIQAALAESETRFQQLAQASDEVFWITDVKTHSVLYVSPAYERVWQRSAQSILENPWDWIEAIHPDDRKRAQEAFEEVLNGASSFEVEFRILLPDGSVRHVLDRGFPVRDQDGVLIRMAGVASDITELHRAREELRKMAETDDLTGALNSRAFRGLLRHELARSQRDQQPLAVALLDIDNFKAVNDEYGHQAGDAVLREVVKVLTRRLRASDIIARLGGDEFCVVLPNAAEASAVQVLSELSQEVSAVRVPLDAGQSVAVTLSVGIAISSGTVSEVPLLKSADQALYTSKRQGRNRVSVAPPLPAADLCS